ncbi:GIY-YIG nuclease family protein [Dehalococcoides mccartyi]|nr:GIY-YIG nuclease family protein [Dehalococcoides mccartyi]
MRSRTYAVYMLTNSSRTLYVGVTNDLQRRLLQHRDGIGSQFTKRYNTHSLVWYETTDNVWSALEREKQLKSWKRNRKLDVINAINPAWNDLSPEIELSVARNR